MPIIDIRIKDGMLEHPKIMRLMAEFGADGLVALIRLWLFTAKYRPKGILYEMDATDICATMGYTNRITDGNTKSILTVLLNLKLVEIDKNNVYKIHDWGEHNPYAFYAPERSKRGKKAIASRWQTKRKGYHTKRITNGNTKRITDGNTPSPIPTPTPIVGVEELNKEKAGALRGAPLSIEEQIRLDNEKFERITQRFKNNS